MAKLRPPSPTDHPNAYGGGLAALTTAVLVYEANNRLGFDLSELEASFIVAWTTAAVLFFGKRK